MKFFRQMRFRPIPAVLVLLAAASLCTGCGEDAKIEPTDPMDLLHWPDDDDSTIDDDASVDDDDLSATDDDDDDDQTADDDDFSAADDDLTSDDDLTTGDDDVTAYPGGSPTVGVVCQADNDCSQGETCLKEQKKFGLTQFSGGICTVIGCRPISENGAECPPNARCVRMSAIDGGLCLLRCDPASGEPCRSEHYCKQVAGFDGQGYCFPGCRDYRDCPATTTSQSVPEEPPAVPQPGAYCDADGWNLCYKPPRCSQNSDCGPDWFCTFHPMLGISELLCRPLPPESCDSSEDCDAGQSCSPLTRLCTEVSPPPDISLKCPGEMMRFDKSGEIFCIDRYEAARRDAVEVGAGIDNSMAMSMPAAMPWTSVTWSEAEFLCRVSGKRLCLLNEFRYACNGGGAQLYPYGDEYEFGACNDANNEGTEIDPTGMNPRCNYNGAIFDMIGNAAEWTGSPASAANMHYHFGGGPSVSPDTTCISEDAAQPQPDDQRDIGVGFRCCL